MRYRMQIHQDDMTSANLDVVHSSVRADQASPVASHCMGQVACPSLALGLWGNHHHKTRDSCFCCFFSLSPLPLSTGPSLPIHPSAPPELELPPGSCSLWNGSYCQFRASLCVVCIPPSFLILPVSLLCDRHIPAFAFPAPFSPAVSPLFNWHIHATLLIKSHQLTLGR